MGDPFTMALIGGAISLATRPSPPRMPPPPPTLSREEALQRAEESLNPLYDEHLDKTLRQVDLHNMRRGFFGQEAGAALSRSTAADIQRSRAGHIARLAEEMRGQSEAYALQQQQLAAQHALQNFAAQQQNFQNLMSGLGMGADLFSQMFNQNLASRRMDLDERIGQAIATGNVPEAWGGGFFAPYRREMELQGMPFMLNYLSPSGSWGGKGQASYSLSSPIARQYWLRGGF